MATYTAPNEGFDSCLRNAGYTVGDTGLGAVPTFQTEGIDGDRRDCTGCAIGLYRESLGVGDCASCLPLMTTPQEATAVYTGCVCREGVGLTDAVCSSCVADKYKPDIGNETCRDCWPFIGTNGGVQQTTCQCKPARWQAGVYLPGGAEDSIRQSLA